MQKEGDFLVRKWNDCNHIKRTMAYPLNPATLAFWQCLDSRQVCSMSIITGISIEPVTYKYIEN
mgnify:CR=1 FL=1